MRRPTSGLCPGGSENYHKTSLAVQKRLPVGLFSLRLGHNLSLDGLFAGFSINTFRGDMIEYIR